MVKFPDFKKIELSDKKLFDSYFKNYPSELSEFTFTNLFAWRISKKTEFSILDNHLIILFYEEDKRVFYQPVGENPSEIIKTILRQFPDSKFKSVEEKIASKIRDSREDRDNYDYLYDLSELKELKGSRYAVKRNFVKRCKSLNPDICILNENDVSEFFKMQKKWCELRNCDEDGALIAENSAVKETLKHFKELNVFGICIRINKEIAGFALGERLNNNTFVEHFEKGDSNYQGIYQYILYEFANKISDEFKFLNREQDLGIKGLRKAKLSYHPLKFVKKYVIE